MKTNNKKLPLIIVAIVLLLGGGIFAVSKMGGSKPTEQTESKKKKTVLEPKNIIDVAMRPYVMLSPVSGGHHINIKIVEVPKEATEVEYELEYQSGTLLQGFGDLLKLDTLPVSTQKLFGSQSAGGAITYHEDIKGGSLQLRFIGSENYVLKQDWRYFENKTKETTFSSKDAKFQIDSDDLALNRLVLIYNTPGVPKGIDEGMMIASDAYSLTSASKVSGDANTVSIRANEEGELTLMGYDGTSWTELDSEVEGKVVTAEDVSLMELYVVVKEAIN
ncbi:MAG: hypothetical protein OEX81_05590 [Candidatus Pacebacteria bacterium]|nr:hypothetical protein [Candidatus Paceibacterota bacterium]